MVIDYVVPMVFHRDEEWRKGFKRAGGKYDEGNLVEFVRYRSWGTEQLLVGLVKKNLPWVRNIIILLADESQVQGWMKGYEFSRRRGGGHWLRSPWERVKGVFRRGPRVRVVFHREFMPEWALPCFNSRAIEMFLHKIPGIADYFIYGNDDMFPLSAMKVEDFFRPSPDGETLWPCLRMTERPFPEFPNNFQSACRCGLNFVAGEFKKYYFRTWLKGGHSLAPIVKKTCEHLWERGGREIMASVTAFRTPRNFNQYIYSWWNWFAGEYYESSPARTYVSVKRSVEEVKEVMKTFEGVVCVNDNECVGDYERYAEAVRLVLEMRLMFPSGKATGTV